MSVILAHPNGNPFTLGLARALQSAGMLECLIIGLAIPEVFATTSLLPRRLREEFGRRVIRGLPRGKIEADQLPELARVIATRLGLRSAQTGSDAWYSLDAMNRRVAMRAGELLRRRPKAGVVYCYEDAALEAFMVAEELGRRSVLELPITDWRTMRRILAEELEHAPAWAGTIEALKDGPKRLDRKDEEIRIADAVCVPSEFVRQGFLKEYGDRVPVHVVPYGGPAPSDEPPASRRDGAPLKVVYVGHVRQRKGVSYLFSAVERVRSMVELTLVGPGPDEECPALTQALAGHRWVKPVPHPEVMRLLSAQHVMVFPSLAEGFGLVILEAMAQGVPVITTPHTGGPDIIEDGVDGFIVPVRDPEAIAERLTWLHDDENRRTAMALAAKRKAAACSWQRYGASMTELLRSLGG